MAKNEIAHQVEMALKVEVLDEKEFTRRVNDALTNLIISRLSTEQMKKDGVIKDKKGV